MLRCQHCGALLRQDWDYCSRCGADLPEDFDRGDHEDRPSRIRGALQSARESIGSVRVAYPSGAAGAVTSRVAPSNWKQRVSRLVPTRGPSTTVLLGTVAVVLALALGLAWWSALDARNELDAVRAEQSGAQAEAQRLAADLQAAQAQVQELQSQLDASTTEAQAALQDLQQQVSGSEEERGVLSQEVVDLRQQLSEVQSDLDEAVASLEARDSTISEQEAAIGVLSDCLSGMQVALAFARAGQVDSADRAFATVSETCNRARELL